MVTPNHFLLALAILAAFGVSACGRSSSRGSAPAPARIVRIPGTNVRQVVLSSAGAERIGIHTAAVQSVNVGPARDNPRRRMTTIPYAAVLYDAAGNAFIYTNPARLTYVRRPIMIDYIAGDHVFLRSGPSVGTTIVTVGEVELLGAEQGVQQ